MKRIDRDINSLISERFLDTFFLLQNITNKRKKKIQAISSLFIARSPADKILFQTINSFCQIIVDGNEIFKKSLSLFLFIFWNETSWSTFSRWFQTSFFRERTTKQWNRLIAGSRENIIYFFTLAREEKRGASSRFITDPFTKAK